ncbi:hypothetical protein ACFP56_20345, partial [Paenibacillus septentrionalis]
GVDVQQCMELTSTNRSRAYPKAFGSERKRRTRTHIGSIAVSYPNFQSNRFDESKLSYPVLKVQTLKLTICLSLLANDV